MVEKGGGEKRGRMLNKLLSETSGTNWGGGKMGKRVYRKEKLLSNIEKENMCQGQEILYKTKRDESCEEVDHQQHK